MLKTLATSLWKPWQIETHDKEKLHSTLAHLPHKTWGSFATRHPSKLQIKRSNNEAFLRDLLQNWSFEAQKRNFSARLPSKMKLWRSKTKHFCETSFKNEALKIKSQAFLWDFLKKSSFEAQKTKLFCETSFKNVALQLKNETFFARLPSKCKFSRWKTKLFCGTSFKNEALKIKNEAFLRDFLQNWHVEQTLDLRIPIRFSDFQVDASKVLRLPRKSWAEAYEVL